MLVKVLEARCTLSFEITAKDLLGRIGKLKTKRGIVETPLILPVVNPAIQVISPTELEQDFGCKALIANAYLLKKRFGSIVERQGIHDFLDFKHTIVTDSGAYQILVYGDIEATQREIIEFEEAIDTDIAVILDIPTGGRANRAKAEYTVEQTIKRAREALEFKTRSDILWVGPIQGGNHLDLVGRSALEMGKLSFDIYALGSPTQVMEQYMFDYLVEMVITAKKQIPLEKPFHLFGAGHPFMFAIAVAIGCDIFDSASYAIYAREGKYLTTQGTANLEELRYFPCSCEICTKYKPKEVLEASSQERVRLLARHNLAVCFQELRNVKQAIIDGRLWELLGMRSRSHPTLLEGLRVLKKYQKILEENSPITHKKGLLFFDSQDLTRPEVIRHQKHLRAWIPTKSRFLVILPEPSSKPFHRSREIRHINSILHKLGINVDVSICIYASPFGMIPLELDEIYPLSQYEYAKPVEKDTEEGVTQQVIEYIETHIDFYGAVLLYVDDKLGKRIEGKLDDKRIREKLITVKFGGNPWAKTSLSKLSNAIVELSPYEEHIS